MIKLPTQFSNLEGSLTRALADRRSVRRFAGKPLGLTQIAAIVWACQGRSNLKSRSTRRNAPSAGATYPMVTYLICGDSTVEGLDSGIYRYNVAEHGLEQVGTEDIRESVASACFSQNFIAEAPASIIIAADYSITTSVYGQRGVRYVHMEAGHAGQNIYLACSVQGLGTVAVGAFNDEALARALNLPLNTEPLYVFPIGYPA